MTRFRLWPVALMQSNIVSPEEELSLQFSQSRPIDRRGHQGHRPPGRRAYLATHRDRHGRSLLVTLIYSIENLPSAHFEIVDQKKRHHLVLLEEGQGPHSLILERLRLVQYLKL